MKKRILRKFADSGRRFNLNNGLFGAEQVQYVVCTAIHNIDGRQTLILYVYAKEAVLAGDFTPRWTVSRPGMITLPCTGMKKARAGRHPCLIILEKAITFLESALSTL